ncbi:glycosyltransferase family 2 protein [Haladaptatus pallidirubidus]|uniref:O antigen biosynthesis rhamnosyltransferase RfbN n=1 Tax=Haladaptatus pallidirubidus TaxID=1008152 RepID=A0AAV3UHN3_9EURY|nr:glycosyltransferase family 2 protein [Haladaptatus pallidirubidus]
MSEVSVVIPTKNAGDQFGKLLNKIRSQSMVDTEIIIIDSGSTDGTVDTGRKLADKIIEISPNDFHHGRTRNIGAEAANGDIIAFTVQDAYPVTDTWLADLINPIETDVADVTYGNQIAHPDAKPVDKFFYKYFYPDSNVKVTEDDTNDEAKFYLHNIFISDVSSAISSSVWDKFQFQDNVDMSEDKDFAYRVANEGYDLYYCSDAEIYHSHDYSIRSLFLRRYKDGMAFKDITSPDSDDFILNGIKYIVSEYEYLIRNNKSYWIPYAILYDFTYFISFIMGKNNEYIPDKLHKILSG